MNKLLLSIAMLVLWLPQGTRAQADTIGTSKPRFEGLYVGPRIGAPLAVGLRAHYIGGNDHESTYYVDVDASTLFVINGLCIGGGVYALGNVLYVGARGHWFSESRDWLIDLGDYAFSAEVGASIPLTQSRSWLFTIDAGPIIIPQLDNRIGLSISIGFVGRLF